MLRQLHYATQGGDRPYRSCDIGTSLLAVDTEGHVMPCHRFLDRPESGLELCRTPRFRQTESATFSWHHGTSLAARRVLPTRSAAADVVLLPSVRALTSHAAPIRITVC